MPTIQERMNAEARGGFVKINSADLTPRERQAAGITVVARRKTGRRDRPPRPEIIPDEE